MDLIILNFDNSFYVLCPLREIRESNFYSMIKFDILWVSSHYIKIPNTLMWVGFNIKRL